MKHKDTLIDIAGMLRCCFATVNEMDLETEVENGQTLDCKYEKEGNKSLILIDGVWCWNQDSSDFRFGE